MKSKDLLPRIISPARLSFKIEGEIRSFPDKEELKEFVNTKPILQQMLKGFLFFFFFVRFIYLFIFRDRGREGERERNINVWLPLTWAQLGTWPATQAYALTGY